MEYTCIDEIGKFDVSIWDKYIERRQSKMDIRQAYEKLYEICYENFIDNLRSGECEYCNDLQRIGEHHPECPVEIFKSVRGQFDPDDINEKVNLCSQLINEVQAQRPCGECIRCGQSCSTATDICERRQSKMDIRQAYEKLSDLAQDFFDGSSTFTDSGSVERCVYCNAHQCAPNHWIHGAECPVTIFKSIKSKVELGRQLIDEVKTERPCDDCRHKSTACVFCDEFHNKFSKKPQIEVGDIVRLKKDIVSKDATSSDIFIVLATGATLSVLMCINSTEIYNIGDKGSFETSKIKIVLKKDKMKEL